MPALVIRDDLGSEELRRQARREPGIVSHPDTPRPREAGIIAAPSTWSTWPGNRAMKPNTSPMSAAPAEDWDVARYASDGDFILVTNNASDFRHLYAAQPLHAGLVILIPAVNRAMQQYLFRAALEELAVIGEPLNRVLEIDLDGDEVTLTLYDWPPARS